MGAVGIFTDPDGTGFVTLDVMASAAVPVVIEVAGERYLVTGWSNERQAFLTEKQPRT